MPLSPPAHTQATPGRWGVYWHEPWPDAIGLYYDRVRVTVVRPSGTPDWMIEQLQAIADHLNDTGFQPTPAILKAVGGVAVDD